MSRRIVLLLSALALAAGVIHAQSNARGPTGQMLYPARGQSQPQAERDQFECHAWAKQQSGFDPAALQAPPMTPAQAKSAYAGGGLVAGAAGGAAIAELADKDAGKGAAAGLLGAGLRQTLQQHKTLTTQQQQALQRQAEVAQARGAYERGFAACMEARGYVVK